MCDTFRPGPVTPASPSRDSAPPGRAALLRGDIETIVLDTTGPAGGDAPRRGDARTDDRPHTSPALAVVITCHNYESFVGRAIDSVLSQGRADCELIVVDDGSTDGSWQVIRDSGAEGVRIRNIGHVGAGIVGLSRTTAPFVLFLDADDLLKPGALARIIGALDPGVAKLQFPLTRIDATGRVLGPALPALAAFRDRERLARRVLVNGCYTSSPTSGNVFRRDLCALLAETDYDAALDGVILFAAPFYGDVVSLSEELGCYRVHGANMSRLGHAPDPRLMARHLERFSATMAHLGRVIERRGGSERLARTEDMFYFQEQRLCAGIAAGRRPGLRDVARLVAAMRQQTSSLKAKCALTVFYTLASVLPIERGQSLLAYRHRFGERSARGFFKAMMLRT